MPKASKPTGGVKCKNNGKRHEEKQAADEDYEQVFQLAVKLEEQGERYQFGAKAKRNYEQAIQSYRHSIDLLTSNPLGRSPSDGFNSHFNLARVLVHFGTTFASAPSECLDFVRRGIHEYQLAIECATKDSNHSDEIDARYNLGLSMSTLAEMLSGGATPTEDLNGLLSHQSPAIQIWKQAKEELSRAYHLQERLLANSPNLGPLAAPIDQVDETTNHSIYDTPQQSQPASPMNTETALVEELFVITPSVLIDTLFDICEVLLSIYPSEPESALTELRHYVQQLQAINQLIETSVDSNFSRRFEIDSLICTIELTTVEHALSETLMNADSSSFSVIAEMSQKLTTVNQKLDELSQDSVALEQDFVKLLGLANNFSSLCTATCSLIAIQSKNANTTITDSRIDAIKLLIERTMALYSTILGKLKESKLRPIKQIRPHEASSYISSSLVGQSELALILELLDRQREGQPPSQTTKSFDLAIEAYNQSLAPYVISRDPTPNSFKLAFSSYSAACSANEKEGRNEWANFSARLESIKWLLRCKFHHVTSPSHDHDPHEHPGFDLEQIIKNQLSPLITKLSLSPADLVKFYEDLQDDTVYILSDSIEKSLFKLLLRSP